MWGNLLFDSNGLLTGNRTLYLDFNGSNGALPDTALGFKAGEQCCGGGNPPNSLKTDSSGNLLMTLWGANYSDGGSFAGSYSGSTLGMDLRVMLTESVPAPTVLLLLTIGLLGFTSRRFFTQPTEHINSSSNFT